MNTKWFAVFLIILSVSTSFGSCRNQTNTPPYNISTTVSTYLLKLGTVEKNLTYSNTDFINLKMDVYYPLSAPEPMPVVLYLHGGAWIGGDKSDAATSPEITELVKTGFLVASVNYGLAPQYSILGQIENAKSAVRFLRANAAYFGINPGKIGAFGSSAGGHLASLLGTSDKSAGLDTSGVFLEQSSRVQAVVDFYGPTDLKALFRGSPATVLQQLIGTSDPNSIILDKISPLTYISADDPPILIVQGDKDSVVPPSQSEILYRSLIAAGVMATLVVVTNGDHSFVPAGGPISPSRTEITNTVVGFLQNRLK
jgi:acetyl esterase/lipase